MTIQKHNTLPKNTKAYDEMSDEQLLLYLFPADLQTLRMAAKRMRCWVAPERIGSMGPDEQLIIQAFRMHLGEIEFVMDLGDDIFEIGKQYEDEANILQYILQLTRAFTTYYLNSQLHFSKEVGPLIDTYEESNAAQKSEVVDFAAGIVLEAVMNADLADLGGEDFAYEDLPYILPEEATLEEIEADFADSIEMIQSLQEDLSGDLDWIETHLAGEPEDEVVIDGEFFVRTLEFLTLACRIIQELSLQNGLEMTANLLYAFSQLVFAINELYEDFIQNLENGLEETPANESSFADEVRRIIEERWDTEEVVEEDEVKEVEEAKPKAKPKARAKKTTASRTKEKKPAPKPKRLASRKKKTSKT